MTRPKKPETQTPSPTTPPTSEADAVRARPGRRSAGERETAVMELLGGKASVDQLARRYGVLPSTIEGWRAEAVDGLRDALRRSGPSPREKELETENRQLKAAVTELSIGQVLLKRALEDARSGNPTVRGRLRR